MKNTYENVLNLPETIKEQINKIKIIDKNNNKRYKAYCKKSDNNFGEYIIVYDFNGNEVAKSDLFHPEGKKYFSWNGFYFMADSYSSDSICYVKINDKVVLKD